MAKYYFKQGPVLSSSDIEKKIDTNCVVNSSESVGGSIEIADIDIVNDGLTDLVEAYENEGYSYHPVYNYDRSSKLIEAFIPLANVTDTSFPFMGDFQSLATGLITDYLTTSSTRNHHLYFYVISILTGGDIVITGSSINEFTGVVTTSDTETLTVDTTGGQYYKTTKRWVELDSIILVGVVGIVYDFGTIGFYDGFMADFKVVGYRLDIRTQGSNSDIRFRMRKLSNQGGGKFEFITIEDYGFDSTNTSGDYVDNIRTAGSDRSYTMSTQLAPNNRQIVFKQLDFDYYFATGRENVILGSELEGIYIDFLGQNDAGITNIDNVFFTLIISI